MNRILGTLFAATVLAACAAPTGLHTPGADPPAPAGKVAWTPLGDAPGPRAGQASVYDAARDRMIVFGGGANDLWVQPFSGPSAGLWERLDPGGEVPPPVAMVAVIDEGSDQLFVFPTDSLERAWSLPLDGSGGWSLVGFGEAPKIELSFSLAVDPGTRRLYAYTSGTPEVWELALDGAGTWTQLAGTPDQSGAFSCRDTLVFDGANARLLVLSGGWPRGNVFALSLHDTPAWTQLNHQEAWFEYGASAFYDAQAGRYIVSDSASSGWVWSFAVDDAAGQWTHLKVAGASPGIRFGSGGVYDSGHHRFVLFGGSEGDSEGTLHDDTWALSLDDAPAWSPVGALDEVMTPAQATGLAATETEDVVRFGGLTTSDAAVSSMVFDARTAGWRVLGDTPGTPLGWSAGSWDPFRHRLVTFGGSSYVEQNQTWALDMHGADWTQLQGAGGRPGARRQHSMVLDASDRSMLVFGGTQSSTYPDVTYFNDTWALAIDSDAWANLDVPGPKPAARAGHAAAFDDAGQRMLVQGGFNGTATLADTWMLELTPSPHWVVLKPTGSAPPALEGHFAAFDPVSRRFLLVGNVPGLSSSTFDGVSVWALSTDGKPRWQRYCPKGTRPATADGALWSNGDLFVTSGGSAWRFDPSTPTCD